MLLAFCGDKVVESAQSTRQANRKLLELHNRVLL